MKTTWIIQTNLGLYSDIQDYVQLVKQSGAEVIEVEYKSFSEELPEVKVEGPVVVCGIVNFILLAQKKGIWPTGIFGSPDTFTYEAWATHYGDMLLNSPDNVELTTVGEFTKTTRPLDEDIFVRPQHDTKSLVGTVYTVETFKNWCLEASKDVYAGVDSSTPILVGKPYGIEAEWRLFVVDNKIAGASQYRQRDRLKKVRGAPEDVLDFAEKVIKKWTPAPAYTLDICRSAGNCYIVEVQGFNSAGHYAADMKAVAEEVNKLAQKLYNEKKLKVKL